MPAPAKTCVSCGRQGLLLSVTLIVYRPADGSEEHVQKSSRSFRVCEDCVAKWQPRAKQPKLRNAMRQALHEVLKRIQDHRWGRAGDATLAESKERARQEQAKWWAKRIDRAKQEGRL